MSYAKMRLAIFVANRHARPRSYGWAMLYASPNNMGLVTLNGIVVAPRPHKAWRDKAERRR